MDTLIVNIDDIEALAAKLETLLDHFSEDEREALKALFHLAGLAVHDCGDVEGFSFSVGSQGILVSSGQPGQQGILIGLNQAFQVGVGGQYATGGGGGAGLPQQHGFPMHKD